MRTKKVIATDYNDKVKTGGSFVQVAQQVVRQHKSQVDTELNS